MKENIIKDKSFNFAINIVKLYQFLVKEKREFVLSKQILRSGTSVGSQIRESEHTQSKLDFIHKLSISQKEINETIYWLELLNATGYIDEINFNKLNFEALELLKLLTSSIKTAKNNLVKN